MGRVINPKPLVIIVVMKKTEESFKFLQIFTAICDSFSHGANDIANSVDEIIIDLGAAKGQNDPLIIHSKEAKTKTEKTSAA